MTLNLSSLSELNIEAQTMCKTATTPLRFRGPHSIVLTRRSTVFGTELALLLDIDGPPSRALCGRPLHFRRKPGWGAGPPPQDVPRVHVQPDRQREQLPPPPPSQQR